MNNEQKTIKPLKKVTVRFTAGSTPDLSDLLSESQSFEFIFGIATDGLTPFECALEGKHSGEEGVIEVAGKNLAEFFGHIISCARDFPVQSDQFYLKYAIDTIADPEPREVVKSIAASGGGCGSGCDCGCGSH